MREARNTWYNLSVDYSTFSDKLEQPCQLWSKREQKSNAGLQQAMERTQKDSHYQLTMSAGETIPSQMYVYVIIYHTCSIYIILVHFLGALVWYGMSLQASWEVYNSWTVR